MSRKSHIIKKLREFGEPKEMEKKEIEEKELEEKELEEKELEENNINATTHFIPDSATSLTKLLLTKANELIEYFGSEVVYFGKTSDPIKRMTGKGMKTEELFGELGVLNEEKDHIPPHKGPHIDNGYKQMYLLTSVEKKADADAIEKMIIEHTWEKNRNKSKGGEGPDGGSPYYIYAVIHESSSLI